MHPAVKKFIREVKYELPYKFRFRTVLEVGSHNINGSPRKYFWFCNYTGVDISKGRGVDVVGRLSQLNGELGRTYGVVISTEMLEHDSTWQKSLKLMYEKVAENGLLIITCAGPKRKEHGTARTSPADSPDTTDYYRNISVEDFESVLPPQMFDLYILQYARGNSDLQFCGVKRTSQPTSEKGVINIDTSEWDHLCKSCSLIFRRVDPS